MGTVKGTALLDGTTYIARHGETVFNAARRIQGATEHTPFTRRGFAQIEAMGRDLAARVRAADAPLRLIASPTQRTRQTIAIIAEHLGRDYAEVEYDARLLEIGMGGWDGERYADIVAREGPIYSERHAAFVRVAPGGESYADVGARLAHWVAEEKERAGDRLVVTHGVTAAVLRALLTGEGRAHPVCGTAIADVVPQGSYVAIRDGRETVYLVP